MSLRRFIVCFVVLAFAASGLSMLVLSAQGPARGASDTIVFGTVTSASQPLDGVTVSARGEGKRITTTVYTDERGRYYFPSLDGGQYRVWAQAVGFETGR